MWKRRQQLCGTLQLLFDLTDNVAVSAIFAEYLSPGLIFIRYSVKLFNLAIDKESDKHLSIISIKCAKVTGERMGYKPRLYFPGTLDFINVHADLVLDVRRQEAGVRLEVFKDDAGPESAILQKLQRSVHQVAFRGGCLKLIQIQTLSANTEPSHKCQTFL